MYGEFVMKESVVENILLESVEEVVVIKLEYPRRSYAHAAARDVS